MFGEGFGGRRGGVLNLLVGKQLEHELSFRCSVSNFWGVDVS